MAAPQSPVLRLESATAELRERPRPAAHAAFDAPAPCRAPARILYVSDSLGAPTHPRGIFNYSRSLVEMLKAAGAGVDLVVEGSVNYSLEGRFGGLAASAPEAINSVRLAEIHRYFAASTFGFRWDYPDTALGRLARRGRRWLGVYLDLRDALGYRRAVRVRNDPAGLEYTALRDGRLGLFDNFLVKRDFYSSSMSRANLGLPPPCLDASGYDLVVIDTPHYVRIRGVPAERVVSVIHDLIPLRDPTMEAHWRSLFLRKLEATLAPRGPLIFVSRCTREGFRAAFPGAQGVRDYIVPPALRPTLTPAAPTPEETAALWASVARTQVWSKAPARPRADLDPTFPYFVTATSDEPRKNIATLVHAFARLRGRANLVILGQIDASRYEQAPNVVFAGYVDDAEKIAWMRGAHGVVFASLSEGFGIPLVEGAAMGLPVLCSDLPVFREVAGDDAGFFDPADPAALARAVQDALDRPAETRARAAALRRSVLARFSQDAVGVEVRALLADLGL